MRPLSATEAITPAIQRTRDVLFRSLPKGRSWKLCATAYVCRMGTLFFPFPLIYLVFLPAVARSAGNAAAAGFTALLLAATVLFTWIFFLCSRLQFAFFDIVVNRGEFVAPAWRKYGPQSPPWAWLKLLFGCLATLACGLPLAAYIRHLVPLFREMQANPRVQAPPQFMAAIFAGYGLFILIFGSAYLVSSLVADFVLPSLALENTGIPEGLRRMKELISQEPGEFFLYVLLKCVLAFAGYMGLIIAWEIVLLLSTAILAGIAFAIGFLLHLAGVPHGLLISAGIILAVVWYLFQVFGVLVYGFGSMFTFLEAYPLYFLGGRYPLLGDLLDLSGQPPIDPYALLGLSPSQGVAPPPPPSAG